MAAAFVSLTTGAASRSVTVPAGTDRLLLVACIGSDVVASRTVTYNGVTLDVASTGNDYVQIHYMLSPPTGAATLDVSGGSLSTVVAAHYTGVGSFQAASGNEGSVASLSFTPSGAGLVVAGISAVSTSHTPVAGTNERHDSVGEWYGDRIVASAGAVTVGVTTATDPDLAGAVFLEPITSVSASGAISAPKPTAAGSASVIVASSGAITAPKPTVSGAAAITVAAASGALTAPAPTVSGAASVVVSASGAINAPKPTASGSAALAGIDASGTPAVPKPTASGTATVTVAASGTPSVPKPTVSGSASVLVDASGAVTAPAPTVSGSASIETLASGSVAAPLPTVSGSVSIIVEVSGAVTAPKPTTTGAVLTPGNARHHGRASVTTAAASASVSEPTARAASAAARATVRED
jgi:hypothetical protein